MLRTTLASLRYRTARLVLSSLAIGLGVAFVTGPARPPGRPHFRGGRDGGGLTA